MLLFTVIGIVALKNPPEYSIATFYEP